MSRESFCTKHMKVYTGEECPECLNPTVPDEEKSLEATAPPPPKPQRTAENFVLTREQLRIVAVFVLGMLTGIGVCAGVAFALMGGIL